jgi:hypothetical protein
MQPIGSSRHYVIVCHDGRRIDVGAESMWPSGSSLEFWATVEVIGWSSPGLRAAHRGERGAASRAGGRRCLAAGNNLTLSGVGPVRACMRLLWLSKCDYEGNLDPTGGTGTALFEASRHLPGLGVDPTRLAPV